MADRASDAGLQDHRGLQEGQWPGDPEGLPPVHCSVPTAGLFAHAVAAIDGSKFKAVNARDKNFTKASIQRRMEQVEASIERYMAALETADRQDRELAPAKSVRLKNKIAALKAQMQAFKAMEAEVHAAPDQQISLTDPDARAMGTSGKGTAVNGARNFPNYGEVKFPSLAGGVISRPVDQGLRFSAAVHDVCELAGSAMVG